MFRFKERSKCFASKMKEICTNQKKRNKSQNKKWPFVYFQLFYLKLILIFRKSLMEIKFDAKIKLKI